MSRVFTIVVILLLMAVVALVPRMGSEEPGNAEPNFGEGYAYKADTLRRFRLLLDDPGWTLADPPRNPQGMLEAVHRETGLRFVLIPAGEFLMGSPEDEVGREESEGPVRRVRVPATLLCGTECTQQAWEKGGGESDSTTRRARCPVERVSWADCREWCAKNGLRLPSESEWEYACRAATSTRFSFGSRDEDLVNYGWFFANAGCEALPLSTEWGNCGLRGEFGCRVNSSAKKRPNPWGLFDMHGNVAEWCEDRLHDDYHGAPMDGTAWTEGGVTYAGVLWRVVRGGHCADSAENCRSAARNQCTPWGRPSFLGFRPASNLP